MSDLQNLICKITADIKSAEIGISMLEGYLQGKGILPGPLLMQELPNTPKLTEDKTIQKAVEVISKNMPNSANAFRVLEKLSHVTTLPTPSTSFGENLRALRLKQGITQLELANMLDIRQSTIAQYETGERSPQAATLAKLADYFGVSIDYLFGRRGK